MKVSDTRPIEERAGEALREVKAPDSLKASTLAAIEAQRAGQPASAPAHVVPIRPKRHARRLGGFIAAAACLAFACVFGMNVLNSPVVPAAYVGIDVNPSIELSVGKDGKVIEAAPVNEDGQAVLASLDLTGMPYEEAFDKLLASDAMAGYLSDDALVSVCVVSDDDALASSIQSQSDEVLARAPCQGSCHRSDAATREAAHDAGMGTARYEAARELIDLDAGYSLDDCKSMSMRELRDAIDSCHESAGATGGQGAHRGHHRAGAMASSG